MNDLTDSSQLAAPDEDLIGNPFDRMPSYLVAANNHQIAAQSWSLTDYAAGGAGTGVGAAVGGFIGSIVPVVGTLAGAAVGGLIGGSLALNEGKFVASSLFSGAASFYNTGVEISNWFGGDATKINVAATLTDYDSDLGAYYRNHQESADLVGFAAGSLIPTVGALKAYNYATGMLNVAKAGEIGANFSAATGLLKSPLQRNIARAIEDMASKDTPMSILNASMLKAFGTGVAEEAIQGAFVSAAVLSTMHASPILEAMDWKDMVWNVVEGSLFNSVIGGTIRGAGIFGNVKTGISAIKAEATPFIYGESLPEGSPLSHRILNAINNKMTMPAAEGNTGETALAYAMRKRTETTRRLDDDIRTDLTTLAGKDSELGLKLADNVAGMPIEEAERHLLNVTEISRVGTVGKKEAELIAANKKLLKEADYITDAEADVIAYSQPTYVKLHGEGEGAVTLDSPAVVSFGDRIPKGTKITITANGVKVPEIGEWKFTPNAEKKWNPFTASNDEWEARNAWAASRDGPTLSQGHKIHSTDLPLLRRAYNTGVLPEIVAEDGSSFLVANKQRLLEEIQNSVKAMRDRFAGIDEFKLKTPAITNPQLAKNLDVTLGYLEGTAVDTANPIRNLFAIRTAAEDYTARLVSSARYPATGDTIETFLQPQFAKLIQDTRSFKDMNGNLIEGMARIKEKARLQQIALDNAVIAVIGEKAFLQLSTFEAREMSKAVAEGGPGVATFKAANNPYGSLGSMFQQIGSATNRIIKSFHDKTAEIMNPAFYQLKNNENAALEWSALQTKLRATPEVYYHDVENSRLVLRRVKLSEEAKARGETPKIEDVLDSKAPTYIPILSPEANAAFGAHINRNSERTVGFNNIKSASGYASKRDARAAYPIPVDQRDYPHFAFVVNDTVTGTGHVSTLYAATAPELETLISKVNGMAEKFSVVRKDEVERYKKSLSQYLKDDTITESEINTALFRSGASANFVPKTDPFKIVDDAMNWHLNQDRNLGRYAITSKYSKEFDELNRMGEAYTGLQTSRVGAKSLAAYVESKVQNPIADYIKTALNMTSTNETPTWTAINNFAETKFTQLWRAVKGTWEDKNTPELMLQADKVNAIFENAGIKTAMYDAALIVHSNHTAPVGALTKFVSRANGILATLQLRMDPANAFVNAASSVILEVPEYRSMIAAIAKGDAVRVGELAHIKLPGTGETILSPMKMEARATRAFFSASKEEKDWYRNNGFMTRHLNEYQGVLDDLAIAPTATAADLGTKMQSAISRMKAIEDFGEKWTGNKLAEEYNRFKAAYMMKSLTDIAVEQGLMKAENALSYINTFVNRTQGNYLASQRPLAFQGALGQAIGLFQNYQFNMMQQLLRHVSEGAGKDAAMILGMQATVYGMHGLPGFDYINNHIIGTMSGNKNNRDLYDAVYGAAGKDAGNWLMYGMTSNALGFLSPDLKANLYSRGDINPRQATVLPIDPAKIPIVNASAKFFLSLKDTVEKIGAGGNVWPTVLQGIEHAGVNRPLAGLAQVLEAFGNPNMQSYGTSGKGNVTSSNDLWSLANLTRLAGAKPLDEAIAVDAAYRLDSYKAADAKAIQNLGHAIKTSVIAGSVPTPAQIEGFAASYAAAGGKQKEFNQFMITQMKNANTSHANAIANSLSSPHAQSMQRMMGGYDLKDFSQPH